MSVPPARFAEGFVPVRLVDGQPTLRLLLAHPLRDLPSNLLR